MFNFLRNHKKNEYPILPDFSYSRTQRYSCGGKNYTVQEYYCKKTDMEYVLIPEGKFIMGSTENDNMAAEWEKPRHWVSIKTFLMSKTPVTQKVWQKIIGDNPSCFKGANKPVERVSWEDCQKFCAKLELKLPSEAQWEYACRANTSSIYYWGDTMDTNFCWYNENSGGETHPVGQKKANAFGLYDMLGNVYEWCEDMYSDNYDNSHSDGSPNSLRDEGNQDVPYSVLAYSEGITINTSKTHGSFIMKYTSSVGPFCSRYRVFRGGSCLDNLHECRCASRGRNLLNYQGKSIGFRTIKLL